MTLNLSNKTILIVEDYPVMRKAIKNMLYTLGAEKIFEAENGLTALSAMKSRHFDIVLCDYHLGEGKNGQQLLEESRYKKLIAFNTLFIIVTAHQTTSLVLSALENKPDEYLAKPFNPQQLLRRLEKSHARKQVISIIEKAIDKGKMASAINQCDKFLAGNNKGVHSQLLRIRADLAIKVGDFKKATSIYQQVLIHREISWATMGMGVVAFFQNDFEQAIEIFKDLIKKNPMLLECYDWLTQSYEALEQTEKAEETLIKAINLSPHSFFRQKKLALVAEKSGHSDIAEQAYTVVYQLGQHSVHQSPNDFSSLAKIYSINDKTDKALLILDEMQQQFENSPEAQLRAATLETLLYQDLGNDELSEESFQRVSKLTAQIQDTIPKDLLLDMAKAHYLKNDLEAAKKIISSLIHNHIDDNDFLNEIRNMHNGLDPNNHSEVLIQKAKQELVKINNQGVSLYKQGQYKEAFSIFEQAIKKMPNNKSIIFNMAKMTLHDLKSSGVTEKKLLLAHHYLAKAKKVEIATDKLGDLQFEFENITSVAR